MLLRGLPLLIQLGLMIFCLVECIQSPEGAVRNLPRWAWILLILFFPIVGAVAWLIAGRPTAETSAPYEAGFPEYRRAPFPGYRHGPRRVLAPDDDPEFLAELGRVNAEQERTLEQWERDLKRREDELRPGDGGGPAPDNS